MAWRKAIPLLIVVFDRGYGQTCNQDGELLPNLENCRKYYKCAQGLPSSQSCPGTLVFDTVLKICNWPENTNCVEDFTPQAPVRESIGGLTEDTLFRVEEYYEEEDEPPRTEEEEKRRKEAIASLFHVRDRKTNPFSRRPTRPRSSHETTTTPSTIIEDESPVRTQQFSSRGSLLFRSQDRAKDRNHASNPDSTEDSNSDSKRDRNHASNPDRNSEGDRDKDKEDLKKQKIKEQILRDLFGDEEEIKPVEEAPIKKSKSKFEEIRCHTGASNELYQNPRNCRKYYKCESGGPSLQSCPANLIFDTSLKICNWPDATACIEDPTADIPEDASSDQHPPKSRNPVINTVDTGSFTPKPIEEEAPTLSPVPSPEHGSVPSLREALEREKLLTKQYPLFDKVKKTVHTLDTDRVEKIDAGAPSNPDNVQRVEFILSEENFEDLFPRRHTGYTYRRLLQAIGKFPAICGYVEKEDESDRICRKTLATMFAHFTQETGNHNPSDPDYEEWRQGLNVVRELGCTETSPGCGYNSNCDDKDSITKKWKCGTDGGSKKFKKYYGRGAKQLSYNFNYGQFSQSMFGDGHLLLDFPDFVATTWLNLASATWFYTTPQPPKPSMLHVIDGTWVPNSVDRENGIEPGFGATINIINGGLECNTKDGRESNQAINRIEYYKQFAWYLYVDFENEALGCAKQKQFSAGGAGALPIYWDKDWAAPYSCRLVNYQTAHSALADGEYVDCVEENFNVKIR